MFLIAPNRPKTSRSSVSPTGLFGALPAFIPPTKIRACHSPPIAAELLGFRSVCRTLKCRVHDLLCHRQLLFERLQPCLALLNGSNNGVCCFDRSTVEVLAGPGPARAGGATVGMASLRKKEILGKNSYGAFDAPPSRSLPLVAAAWQWNRDNLNRRKKSPFFEPEYREVATVLLILFQLGKIAVPVRPTGTRVLRYVPVTARARPSP
jgi:hypothetical protein